MALTMLSPSTASVSMVTVFCTTGSDVIISVPPLLPTNVIGNVVSAGISGCCCSDSGVGAVSAKKVISADTSFCRRCFLPSPHARVSSQSMAHVVPVVSIPWVSKPLRMLWQPTCSFIAVPYTLQPSDKHDSLTWVTCTSPSSSIRFRTGDVHWLHCSGQLSRTVEK